MMIREVRSRRILAAMAGAAMLSVALPQSGALAQDAAAPAAAGIEIDIPGVTAENSNVTADRLQAIFLGEVEDYADELAGLSADRILIPELTITMDGPEGSEPMVIVYENIEMIDVDGGVAARLVSSNSSLSLPEEISASFGEMSASNVDFAALLAFYGLIPAADSEFRTIYTDFAFVGGPLEGPDVSCEIGNAESGGFRARALSIPFNEFMARANAVEEAEDEPDPEVMRAFLEAYVDMLTAFESDPVVFDGLSCEGTDEHGSNVTVTMGTTEIGAFSPGRYPTLSTSDLMIEIDSGPDAGEVSIGYFAFKGFDYTTQLELFETMPADPDDAWFEANVRRLIPAWEGLTLEELNIDVPDEESPDQRVQLWLGSFDLTLANYVNSVPASISSSASELVFTVPDVGALEPDEDGEIDETAQAFATLRALGIEELDLGYDFALDWDEANEAIRVERIAVSGADLGSIAIAGMLANATAGLFSLDTDEAMMAGMGLTVTSLDIDVVDQGMVDLFMAISGAEQNMTPTQMRPMIAGVAEGMAVGLLGGTPMATQVGAALGNFLRGGSDTLSLRIESNDPEGLGMIDFMMAEENPAVLLERVTISAE